MADSTQIFIVEDDIAASQSLGALLRERGFIVHIFQSGEEWLKHSPPSTSSCAIVDLNLEKGLSGLDVMRRMSASGMTIPVIMISAYGDIRTAVTAIRLGAVDFLEKPFETDELIQTIDAAIRHQSDDLALRAEVQETERLIAMLTEREQAILEMVCEGTANKVIAKRLDLGLRTVESCRASLLKSFGSTSWPEVIAKIIRSETYRTKHPNILPPKFLKKQGSGTQGRLDAHQSDSGIDG